jgi:chromate reductase
MTKKTIAVLVGSLRQRSYNKIMAQNLIRMAPKNLLLEIVELQNLEIYNQDFDENPPQAWMDFREKIKACDGLLFVTPEYNRSVLAVLKNAIDIGSRPYGQSVWNKKPSAIVSVSPGAIGAFGANHHLRQSLVFLNVPTMQQPEAYIGGAADLFDENSNFKVPANQAFMQKFMNSFAEWVDINTSPHPTSSQVNEVHSKGVRVGDEAAP